MVKNDFDIDIKVKCLEERVTQAQLAEMVGTSAPYISRLINKKDGIVNKVFVEMLEKLKNIVDKISEQGKMSFFDGVTEELITRFEEENNVKLPTQYREWLTFSDGGECFLPAGVQFYGIEHKPTIDVNSADCPDDKYVVIGALSTGDPILCERDGEKISIYNLEGGRIEEDEVYEDFYSFLSDLYDLLGIGG